MWFVRWRGGDLTSHPLWRIPTVAVDRGAGDIIIIISATGTVTATGTGTDDDKEEEEEEEEEHSQVHQKQVR